MQRLAVMGGAGQRNFGIRHVKLVGGTAPIISPNYSVYSNPLPHVLMLTAIVVGVATLALGLALAVRIREAYGSIEEDEILARDHTTASGEEQR